MAAYRYRLARRPFLDAAGRLHPKGSFILALEAMLGDNFVPVNEQKEDIGPARGKPTADHPAGEVFSNNVAVAADPFGDVTDVNALRDEIASLQAKLADAQSPVQPFAAAVAAPTPPDGDGDGNSGGSEPSSFDSFTKAQIAEKLDAAGIAKPDGVADWSDLKKDQLVALIKGG